MKNEETYIAIAVAVSMALLFCLMIVQVAMYFDN